MLIRILAATVAGGIVFFGFGFVIFGILLDPYFKANMIEYPGLAKGPMPDMIFLVAWNLAMAFYLAFIFEKWAGIRTLVGGLKGGATLIFLVALMTDMQYMAFLNLWKGGPLPVIVDILAATVLGSIAGGAVGLVLGAMSKDSSSD